MCENEKKKYHSIEMTTGSLWNDISLQPSSYGITGTGGSF